MANKTSKYLANSLNLFSSKDLIASLKIINFYIGHSRWPGEHNRNKHLYILIDADSEFFSRTFKMVESTEEFVEAYEVGSLEHFWMMFVFKIPDIFDDDIIKNFIMGAYSKMYSQEIVDVCFPSKNSDAYKVLTKSQDKLEELADAFGYEIEEACRTIYEYDTLSLIEEEIYEYDNLLNELKQLGAYA